MTKPIPKWAMWAAKALCGKRTGNAQYRGVAKIITTEFERTGLLKAVKPFLDRDPTGTHWEDCYDTHRRCALVRAYDKAKEVGE